MTQVLDATPAAETMDGIYRRQRFIYDATRRYYLFGRDRLIAGLDVPAGGTVLEIGCGTARNLILAAQRYPSGCFYGLDVSEQMLITARASIARRGFESRIVLNRGDASTFEPAMLFGIDRFDRIFVSYVLSMMPTWPDAVRHAAALLAPGGVLSIVDFGGFDRYPSFVRAAQHAWLRRFSVKPIAGFEGQIRRIAEQAHCDCTAETLYGGYSIHARIARAKSAVHP